MQRLTDRQWSVLMVLSKQQQQLRQRDVVKLLKERYEDIWAKSRRYLHPRFPRVWDDEIQGWEGHVEYQYECFWFKADFPYWIKWNMELRGLVKVRREGIRVHRPGTKWEWHNCKEAWYEISELGKAALKTGRY